MKKLAIWTIIFVFIDQLSKILIDLNMNLYESVNVIPNFFKLTYVLNDGAAFSMLSGARWFFVIIAIIFLILIYKCFIKDKNLNNYNILSISLLIGGILGNLIDRIFFGYVKDFLSFKIFNYDFAIFNLADTFIVISLILIIIGDIYGTYSRKRK